MILRIKKRLIIDLTHLEKSILLDRRFYIEPLWIKLIRVQLNTGQKLILI